MNNLLRAFLFSLIVPCTLGAQSANKADSLIAELNYATNDSVKAVLCRKIFSEFILSNMDSAEIFAKQELELARKIASKRLEGDANEDMARIAWQRNDLATALNFLQSTLEIREKDKDKKGIANCENNIGIIYWNLKNSEEALEHYKRAMIMRVELNDSSGIASSYGNIGLVYREMGKLDSADAY